MTSKSPGRSPGLIAVLYARLRLWWARRMARRHRRMKPPAEDEDADHEPP